MARRAEELAAAGTDAERAIAELASASDHRRQPLEEARDYFVARLHRRSDDYNATLALRLVIAVLQRAGWSERTVT